MALMLVSGAVSRLVEKVIPEAWLEAFGVRRARVVIRIATFGVVFVMMKKIYKMYRVHKNNQKRQRKRANKSFSIRQMTERCRDVKTEDVDRIIHLSFVELRDAIQSGKLKPSQVLIAYQAKSLEAHHRTNCITEYIREAEFWAKEADDADERDKPLFGIPISLKEDIPLNGYDSTKGLIECCECPSDRDCAMVQMLRNLGAIPFCRTNVPQFLTAFEVSNPIFGATCHPQDTSRGSGGSSGGESSLIASGASILGIGSDLGGSIRNPSNFTGLCGFKPTAERYRYKYFPLAVRPAWGPLARDMETVVTVAKALLDGKAVNQIDALMTPLPFNEEVYSDKKSLRIGYYLDNGLLETVPAVKRAVRQALNHLEAKGHTLIQWLPPDIEAIRDLEFDVLFADGGLSLFGALEHDTMDDCVKYIFAGKNIPRLLRPLVARLVEVKDPKKAKLIRAKYQRTVGQLSEISATVKQSKRKVLEEWRKMNIDAIVCPAWAYPAPPLKSADLCIFSESYTMLYNVLNFPAGVVRMTSVTEEDNELMKNYPENDMYQRRVKKAMEGSVGLPVGVQVVTPWYEDELCLRVMKEVEGAADFHVMNKQ